MSIDAAFSLLWFLDGNEIAMTGYIRVPGIWNGYRLPESNMMQKSGGNGKEQGPPENSKGQKLPGEGYATYRLIIHTNGEEPVLGLKILDFATSCRLWVNSTKKECN
ncbi:MAG: hypothetical protein ACM3XR_10290 [Bacillota bacterium]